MPDHFRQTSAGLFILFVGLVGCHYDARFMAMTDAELVSELARPENRMPNRWMDRMSDFRIGQNGYGGHTFGHLDFGGSVPPAVSYVRRNRDYSRLLDRPAALIPLLGSHDTEVVLTTLWVYSSVLGHPDTVKKVSSKYDLSRVAEAIRSCRAQHRDTRVHWMVLSVLFECGWLNADDVVQGLKDPSPAVRYQALTQLATWESRCRKTFYPQQPQTAGTGQGGEDAVGKGPGYEICMLDRPTRAALIPALIDGLEDPHPLLRDHCYMWLERIVRALKPRESTAAQPAEAHPEGSHVYRLPPGWPTGLKPGFFVYSDWSGRHAVVEQIRGLWQERSAAILDEAMQTRALVADR